MTAIKLRHHEGPLVNVALGLMFGAVCSAVTVAEVAKHYETPKIKRVEVCSPRSVDSYPPVELRRIAAFREREEKNRRMK